MIELGGNIKLVGFNELEPAKLIVVKKMVGNYARKIHDKVSPFEELSLHLKEVHSTENIKNKRYEIKGKLVINTNPYNAEILDYNLFFAIDKVLAAITDKQFSNMHKHQQYARLNPEQPEQPEQQQKAL
ncbi:hypothetical protein J4409_00775 [Candidatus Woesearchaeota archaeon]|nr:hypothetical protein [Candidatus Woesearchaeota archaeon]